MDKIQSLLKSTPISQIMKKDNLILLSPKDNIGNALKILNINSITSSAIYDEGQKSFLGFVDVLDICLFIVRLFAENYQKHPHLYDPKELKTYFSRPVSEVISNSFQN